MTSRRFKVCITDFITDALEPERKALGDIADVAALGAHRDEELRGRVEDADALIVYHEISLSRQTIERLKHCKLIVRGGVGCDNVDGAAARARGVPLANIPDYGTEEVADSAIAMALALARGVTFLNSRLRARQGAWTYAQAKPVLRLRGRVFGIVGLGRIGTAAALRAKALGLDVVFYDPYVPDGRDKAIGVRRAEHLDDLLRQSFVLSLHCPLTPETRHMINAATIARMPRGSFLVNTARGAVVDHAAIPAAIASGQLAGAGIDVLPDEPPPEDDPLVAAWRDPNHPAHHRVIVNPHAAFYCEEGFMEIRMRSADAVRRALLGQPVRNVVN
jgi:D-3-phosphoglycerate dehydrogenase/C-terminal binding protein